MMNKKAEKETLKKSPEYATIYRMVSGRMRERGLYTDMPGFAMILQACCIKSILKYDTEEEIYEMVEQIMIVPSIYPVIKDIHPIEQWMKEVLRASGIKEDPMEFVENLVKEVEKALKETKK